MEIVPSSANVFPLKPYLLSPILILIISLYFFKRYKSFFFPSSKVVPALPPGPKPWPLIGNLLQMGNDPHTTLAELAKSHGPLISFRLGTQLVVVGSSTEAAAEILKTKDHLLSGRCVPHISFAKDPELNKESIAWNLECSERWKFFRTLMRNELFSSKMIDGQSIIRETKAYEMVEFLSQNQGEKKLMREVTFAYVFNVLSNIYISQDLTGFEGEKCRRVRELVKEMMGLYTAPNVSDWFPVLGRFDFQGFVRRSEDCVKQIRELWDGIIRDRRSKLKDGGVSSRRRDFLDALIQSGLHDDQISYTFVELIAAVTHTANSTMEWAFSELVKNPHSMQKLREELSREIPQQEGGRCLFIREFEVANLPYLHACIKEALRLHPTAPLLLPHRAIENTQILNYRIPKNTQVHVNIWAIARDPSIWEDPLSYKPERFLNRDLDYKGNHFDYLPFGSGRRICAGVPMAIRMLQMCLACLVHYFDWSLPDNKLPSELDMNEKYGVTLSRKESLVLIANRRN